MTEEVAVFLGRSGRRVKVVEAGGSDMEGGGAASTRSDLERELLLSAKIEDDDEEVKVEDEIGAGAGAWVEVITGEEGALRRSA